MYGYPSKNRSAKQLPLGNQMERIPVPEERVGGLRILPKQLKGKGSGVLLVKRHFLKLGHWHGLAEVKVEPSARFVQLLPHQLQFGGPQCLRLCLHLKVAAEVIGQRPVLFP